MARTPTGSPRGQSPAAVQLLDICAYLAPEPVPLDLFTTRPGLLPEPLSSAAADPLAFNEAVAVLVDHTLAKRTSAGLQLRRLVQAAVRARHDRTPPPPRPQPREQHTPVPGDAAGHAAAHPLGVALGLLFDTPGHIRAPKKLPHGLAATGHLDSLRIAP